MKTIPAIFILCAACAASALPSEHPGDDYGFLYWKHGWRGRSPGKERLVCVQTNRYLAEFDADKAALKRLGPIENARPYSQAVSVPEADLNPSAASILQLEVSLGESTYFCIGTDNSALKGLESPLRIIETGHYLQRFDINNLVFQNGKGEQLSGTGRLEVVAWPDRISLLLEVSLPDSAAPGRVRVALKSEADTVSNETPLENGKGSAAIMWRPDKEKEALVPGLEVSVTDMETDAAAVPVSFDRERGWFLVDLPERQFNMAQQPEHRDRYALHLVNHSETSVRAPLLFALEGPFSGIIGMTPMLLDKTGEPTGLPVQISKNWHSKPEAPELYEGPWFHGFARIPLGPGETWTGSLQFVYALWGGVPAASHAQLCLIGWGVNQQWDQVAIGSWGESICYDPDINLNRSIIDDVRPLLVHGMGSTADKPALWTWTNNVGGGDFLTWFDASKNRQFPEGMRTAYLRQGPNLTEAVYAGTTGEGSISMRITVSSPRCDDVNRAFHYLRYDVLKPAPFSRLAFYQLGADQYNDHQFKKLARGNREGLSEEWAFQTGGEQYDRSGIPCEGNGPWWFSAHEAIPNAVKGGAWANRGLIVRSWKARLGGREIDHPYASFFGTENGVPGMNVELTPPPDISRLEVGDYVEATLELVVVPMKAEDYYGPNANLHQDLERHGNTWEPVYRLARLNDLSVIMRKGILLRAYPLLLRADADGEVNFSVRGGAGYAPCTITGLRDSAKGTLVHLNNDLQSLADSCTLENQYRQADYNAESACYEVTYNLPLDTPDDMPQDKHFQFSVK